MGVTSTDVYNLLLAVVGTPIYPRVEYDATTHVRILSADLVAIQSFEFNETRISLVQSKNTRAAMLDVGEWVWEAVLRFSHEIDTSALIELLRGVPRSGQLQLKIQSLQITHPPRQQPNTGTVIKFTVNAVITPG